MEQHPERFYRVTKTQLSIARFSGECIYNGRHYVYVAENDTLIRNDIFKRDEESRRAFERSERKKFTEMRKNFNKTGSLF